MKVTYNKLWKLLIDKNMKKTELQSLANLSSNTLANMGKNEFVSMKSLVSICEVLECNFGDIIDIIK